MINTLNTLVFLLALGVLLIQGGNLFIAAVGGWSLACLVVFGLLYALSYQGPPLTKNEPFPWAVAYPKISKKKVA